MRFVLDDKEVRRKIQHAIKHSPKVIERALRVEVNIEAKEAKQRTPVDTGALRASVHATEPEWEGTRVSAMIAAGGPAAPYALYVHEDLDAHHVVGQAKFIESVMFESAPFIAARVASRIDLNDIVGR